MVRATRWRAGAAVSLLPGVLLMLTGCHAAATPAPTAVRSTDLAGSESGFDEHAALGIITDTEAASAGQSVSASQTAAPSFGNTEASRLKQDGYRPFARATKGLGATAAAQAMRALVKAGAKLVVIDADGSAALSAATQSAHDGGRSSSRSVPTNPTGHHPSSHRERSPITAYRTLARLRCVSNAPCV